MANSNNNNNISVKLLIDTKSQKVLFAEAGKDFVDFLITLLALPIGTVIRLLTKKTMVGTLGNLYHSIETLSDTYIQPNLNKDTVLNPKVQLLGGDNATSAFLSLPSSATPSGPTKMYRCGSQYCTSNCVSSKRGVMCPCRGYTMSTEMTILAPPAEAQSGGGVGPTTTAVEGGGYVKGVVTYMVMDDLVVKPMSTISSIAMLNKFNVKEVGALEERTVSLGMNEGLKLLEASLRSNTVLTEVLLHIKKTTKKT